MPQDGVSKGEAHGQVVGKRFERACDARLRKIGMHPPPPGAVAIAAIMALHAKAKRFAGKFLAVKNNSPRKLRVGMWRSGNADPASIAECHAKMRGDAQIPRNLMALRVE